MFLAIELKIYKNKLPAYKNTLNTLVIKNIKNHGKV